MGPACNNVLCARPGTTKQPSIRTAYRPCSREEGGGSIEQRSATVLAGGCSGGSENVSQELARRALLVTQAYESRSLWMFDWLDVLPIGKNGPPDNGGRG